MHTDLSRYVHRDAEIMGGELVFVGTRVPVSHLFDHLRVGITLTEFLSDFPSVTLERATGYLEALYRITEAAIEPVVPAHA